MANIWESIGQLLGPEDPGTGPDGVPLQRTEPSLIASMLGTGKADVARAAMEYDNQMRAYNAQKKLDEKAQLGTWANEHLTAHPDIRSAVEMGHMTPPQAISVVQARANAKARKDGADGKADSMFGKASDRTAMEEHFSAYLDKSNIEFENESQDRAAAFEAFKHAADKVYKAGGRTPNQAMYAAGQWMLDSGVLQKSGSFFDPGGNNYVMNQDWMANRGADKASSEKAEAPAPVQQAGIQGEAPPEQGIIELQAAPTSKVGTEEAAMPFEDVSPGTPLVDNMKPLERYVGREAINPIGQQPAPDITEQIKQLSTPQAAPYNPGMPEGFGSPAVGVVADPGLQEVQSLQQASPQAAPIQMQTMDDPIQLASEAIKGFEGFSEEAYPDAGGWAVGYGQNTGIKEGDRMTREEADAALNETVGGIMAKVNTEFAGAQLTPYQKAAVTSLIYNTGWPNFKFKSNGELTNAYQALKVGDFETFMREAFDKDVGFVKSEGKPHAGLQKRRGQEQKLFMR